MAKKTGVDSQFDFAQTKGMENRLYHQNEKKPNGDMFVYLCLCRLVGLFVFVFSWIQGHEYENQPSL